MRSPNRFRVTAAALFLLAIVTVSSQVARGAVSLSMTPTSNLGTFVVVPAGGTFSFSLTLTSSSSAPADQVTAVSYSLGASVSNLFTISSRNTTTVNSAFPDTASNDSAITGAKVSTTYGMDETASVSNTLNAVSNGTFEMADYVIAVGSGTSGGTFTINTMSQPGAGYSGPATGFATAYPDMQFSSQASMTVDVLPAVPEPSTAALLATGCAAALLRPKRCISR